MKEWISERIDEFIWGAVAIECTVFAVLEMCVQGDVVAAVLYGLIAIGAGWSCASWMDRKEAGYYGGCCN